MHKKQKKSNHKNTYENDDVRHEERQGMNYDWIFYCSFIGSADERAGRI